MPLWGNTDANTSSVIYAPGQYNLGPTLANAAVLFGNTTPNVIIQDITVGMFGVDANEQQAFNGNAAPTHAGWVLKTTGQGGRAGRVQYETLVAMGSMTSDAEDSDFVDYLLVIGTQPASNTQVTGNSVVFFVDANSVPTGATIRYQWQVDGGLAVKTWANIANAGIYASASGNTTNTLRISNNATVNNNVYRVLVSTDGAAVLPSGNATIFVL